MGRKQGIAECNTNNESDDPLGIDDKYLSRSSHFLLPHGRLDNETWTL
jgi:hypothetical protein